MKTRLALLLSILASLLCVLGLPLWSVRYALFMPEFYRRWLRESDFVAQVSLALANDLPRRIPEATWPAWLPRAPEQLRSLFDYVLVPSEVEALGERVGPSWAAWLLGEAPSPERVTPEMARQLSGDRGENIRAFLWRALPSCEAATPPACLPADPGAHAAVGRQQQAWWSGFTGDFIAMGEAAEARLIAAWQAPGWLRWVWYAPLLAFILALIATALMPDRRRWVCMSVPLLTTGLFVGSIGGLAWLDRIAPPDIRALTGIPFSMGTLTVFASLWHALMRILGPLWLMGGAVSLALGLLWLTLTFEHRSSKGIVVALALLTLWGGVQFYPGSLLTPVATLPPPTTEPTPTPWPTFTSTPTLTPTPHYWPVSPGTPAPTPSGPFTSEAQLLGCIHGKGKPLLALRLADDEIQALSANVTLRYRYPALNPLPQVTHPLTFTAFALTDDGTEIAVAQERNLYLYTFPSWSRTLRSRIATFAPIRTLAYAVGRTQLVLGLENGYLWVINPANGAIVWLLKAGDSAVTALAAHPTQPLVLAGMADGRVLLWDMANGAQVAVLEGHTAAVQFLVFAPSGDRALSVDAVGQWMVWDVAQRNVVRQRTPTLTGALSTLTWTEGFILGGTTAGELLFADEDLTFQRLPVAQNAITAVHLDAAGAALIAAADGTICIWGVLHVP